MFVTYVLYSRKLNRYYVGHTQNMDVRLAQHNRGMVKSTKGGRPWQIIYTEPYETKNGAYGRERKIKSYKSGRAFTALIGTGVGTEAVKRGRL